MKTRRHRKQQSMPIRLRDGAWEPQTRKALQDLISRGSGKELPVVFDFDNTIVSGDIGEATLAVLVRDGILRTERIPACLSPAFRSPSGRKISVHSVPDLTAYYAALIEATADSHSDPSPFANGYVWAVEAMTGLSPLQIIKTTAKAYALSKPGVLCPIVVTPGKTSFPAPFVLPEMAELLAQLRRCRFDVWIVSASNVWSVRWMVARVLNPLIQKHGVRAAIPPDHVIGVSTLLMDRRGRLHKDTVLARENPGYAALDPAVLRSLRLTSKLQFPAATYGGKVACIWESIGQQPFLGAGDSPGDLPMLTFCNNRLWIERPEKASYQQQLRRAQRRCGNGGWMIHKVKSASAVWAV
jgi:hypothetical protein